MKVVTSRLMGDPPPDLEARRQAAETRTTPPEEYRKMRNDRLKGRGQPLRSGR